VCPQLTKPSLAAPLRLAMGRSSASAAYRPPGIPRLSPGIAATAKSTLQTGVRHPDRFSYAPRARNGSVTTDAGLLELARASGGKPRWELVGLSDVGLWREHWGEIWLRAQGSDLVSGAVRLSKYEALGRAEQLIALGRGLQSPKPLLAIGLRLRTAEGHG
jgi:hypothetical protein